MRLLLLLLAQLLLAGCATTSRLPAAADPQLDSALTAAGIPPLRAGGKIKIGGNFYLQSGQGNVQADNTKAGQRAAAAAVGPGAVATSPPAAAGPAWWVFGLVAVGGALAWEWLRPRLPFVSFRR